MNNCRTALVMGGTSGIGLGAAYKLNQSGIKTIIVGRDYNKARKIAQAISPHCSAVSIDLSQPESYESIHNKLNASIDILVANGPGFTPGPVLSVNENDLCSGFETMFKSIVSIINQVLPHMREQGWGRIVYVSSSTIVAPAPDLAVSSIMRAAMNSYLKLLATSLAADRITVNSVLPGKIDTPRIEQIDKVNATRLGMSPETRRKNMEESIPMKRYGTPEEIGSLITYLASEEARYITGSTFRCDGGVIQSI